LHYKVRTFVDKNTGLCT